MSRPRLNPWFDERAAIDALLDPPPPPAPQEDPERPCAECGKPVRECRGALLARSETR